ncbi:MAG: PEP-CTERM sorting domain-containing protein [Verrucomicrobiaceae bacterium]
MKNLLFLSLLIAPLHGAIIIDGFSAPLHDRFANNGSFIANSKDLSGVGRLSATASSPASGSILPWATMLSNNVFVAASHTVPGGTVTFYPGNDPTATPVVRTVASTSIISGSDITLGVLSTPVPSTIAFYAYETETISDIAGANVEGKNAYLSGVTSNSGASYGATGGTTNQAVGRNLIDGFAAAVDISGRPTDVLLARYNLSGDTTPQPYTTYETLQQGGDSGSPLFVDDGVSGLQLVGITSAIGTVDDPLPERDVSAYAYLGNYSGAIDSYIAANAVPEPGTATLLLLSGIFFLRRR